MSPNFVSGNSASSSHFGHHPSHLGLGRDLRIRGLASRCPRVSAGPCPFTGPCALLAGTPKAELPGHSGLFAAGKTGRAWFYHDGEAEPRLSVPVMGAESPSGWGSASLRLTSTGPGSGRTQAEQRSQSGTERTSSSLTVMSHTGHLVPTPYVHHSYVRYTGSHACTLSW